jgi:hypothetical protein
LVAAFIRRYPNALIRGVIACNDLIGMDCGAIVNSLFKLCLKTQFTFALVAGLYPAIRAARVDPSALTRGELR